MQHLRILAQWKGTGWNRRSICSTLTDWLFVWWIISLLIALLLVLWLFYVVHVIPTPSCSHRADVLSHHCHVWKAARTRWHGATHRSPRRKTWRRCRSIAATCRPWWMPWWMPWCEATGEDAEPGRVTLHDTTGSIWCHMSWITTPCIRTY